MSSSLEVRIFLGYLLQGEIAIHLSQSSQALKQRWQLENPLTQAYWQEKEYIGLFIMETPSYEQLKQTEQTIKSQLQVYCPKLNLDKQTIYLFPQVFLS